jgi:hypothetical protein
LNWVWAKFMEATGFRNDSDRLPEKLISDLDRTHTFHFSGIYELPFGKGKPLLSGARCKAAAGTRGRGSSCHTGVRSRGGRLGVTEV